MAEKKDEKKNEKAKKVAEWKHLKYPYLTEKSVTLVERTNTIVFIVDLKANKKQIKDEFEKMFEVKVAHVNTEIDSDGKKRAFIKLKPEFNAGDIATKMGVV
jgi:large subunit ribosomal protein L23Ae